MVFSLPSDSIHALCMPAVPNDFQFFKYCMFSFLLWALPILFPTSRTPHCSLLHQLPLSSFILHLISTVLSESSDDSYFLWKVFPAFQTLFPKSELYTHCRSSHYTKYFVSVSYQLGKICESKGSNHVTFTTYA